MGISVLINTLNEEKNIRNCLESVKWADEIIIVDMYSDDLTIEIAKSYTNKIYLHEKLGYVEPARQFALDKATNDWILVIDADEMVPIELKDKLIDIMQENLYDVVSIPRKNYFFGYPMKGSGWGPIQDTQLRFFSKGFVTYESRIHAFARISPQARVFKVHDEKCSFIHFNYLDAEQFLEKLNRYTTIEAKNALSAGESFSVLRILYQVVKEIGRRYFLKNGYKDGVQGLMLALLMGAYRVSAGLKLYLLEKYQEKENIGEKIELEYEKVARKVLGGYQK